MGIHNRVQKQKRTKPEKERRTTNFCINSFILTTSKFWPFQQKRDCIPGELKIGHKETNRQNFMVEKLGSKK